MYNKQQHINMSSVLDLECLDVTCGLIDVVPVTIMFKWHHNGVAVTCGGSSSEEFAHRSWCFVNIFTIIFFSRVFELKWKKILLRKENWNSCSRATLLFRHCWSGHIVSEISQLQTLTSRKIMCHTRICFNDLYWLQATCLWVQCLSMYFVPRQLLFCAIDQPENKG